MSEHLWVFGLMAAVVSLACASEPASSGGASTTTMRSAVTSAAPLPNTSIAYRENDFGRPPGWVGLPPPSGSLSPASAPPAAVPASQYRGHFGNKVVDKPIAAAASSLPASPAPPAEYLAKQAAYLQQLQQLEPSLAGRPTEEQELQRAALKRSVLGQ